MTAAIRLIGLAAAVGAAFGVGLLVAPHSTAELRQSADELGAASPIVFIALTTLLTCALFPYPVIAGASGLLFGTAGGTIVAIVTGLTGAVAAFAIARVWGAAPIAELASDRVRRIFDALGRRAFVAILFLRIVPGVPRDLVNYGAGVTPVGLYPFAAATLLGTAPRAYAYAALGSSFAVGRPDSPQAVTAVALLVALAVVGGLLLVRVRARFDDRR